MTIEEILRGLEYRSTNLENAIEALEETENFEDSYVLSDMCSRQDEISSLHRWITENKDWDRKYAKDSN